MVILAYKVTANVMNMAKDLHKATASVSDLHTLMATLANKETATSAQAMEMVKANRQTATCFHKANLLTAIYY